MAIVKIDLEDLIIFEGTSKLGKPYSFVKLDRRYANDRSTVRQLKEAGVRVNGNVQTSDEKKIEIEK